MSSDDNRADTNLLLLCIEHSYEVDEAADRFPAEMLRDWKQEQLAEYQRAERGWPLSDAEAGRVLEASSPAVEHHSAGALLGVIRAVERLSLAARRVRSGPATAAAAWRAGRARARHSFSAWDTDGNAVYAEPSAHETRQHSAALEAALDDVNRALYPLAEEAKVELAAIRVARPSGAPWSAWCGRAIDQVVAVSATWPAPPELEDDSALDDALAELAAAADSMSLEWRGEQVEPPPTKVSMEPPIPARDPLQEHKDLLDLARPYSRVSHRPYDAGLRAEVAEAAQQAASIPPVASAMAFGLSTTCALAAAVSANATDGELTTLAREDARRRPLSAAFLLLAESARFAEKRDRLAPQAMAETELLALWSSIDWSAIELWDSEDANISSVMWAGARATTPDAVNAVLTLALEQQPEILLPLVSAGAEWIEHHALADWQLLGIRRRYRELPSWFPTRAVVSAAAVAQLAETVVVDEFGETAEDNAESLLAQVLWIAERSSA